MNFRNRLLEGIAIAAILAVLLGATGAVRRDACNCRMLIRVIGGAPQATCSTDNCPIEGSCSPVIRDWGGTWGKVKICMCVSTPNPDGIADFDCLCIGVNDYDAPGGAQVACMNAAPCDEIAGECHANPAVWTDQWQDLCWCI
jgi:hypothetical protein